MAPSLRQLRYFTVVAEELHFGRAARRLNISQPPLSSLVRQLEESLGFKLLERTSRQVALTPAGKVFADRCRKLLTELEVSTALARTVSASPGGVLRLGFVPSMVFLGLPELLNTFQLTHPGYVVELQELNSASQIAAMLEDRIDLGFVYQFADAHGGSIESELLSVQPFVCCVPAGHRFADRESIQLAEVSNEPLITFSRERAPAFQEHIFHLLAEHGAVPKVAHLVGNWFTVVTLVGFGMGVALVPATLSRIGDTRVRFVALNDLDATCSLHCVWPRDRPHDGRTGLLECAKDIHRDFTPAD